MFEYEPGLFNLAKNNIDKTEENITLATSQISDLISKASSLNGFTYVMLLTEMKDYLTKASTDMASLKDIERNVRQALNIEEPLVGSDDLTGFTTSTVNLELLTVDKILEIVKEINSGKNPYGNGEERVKNLTNLYGAKTAEAVQKTINNNGIVPKYIADMLNSENNNITIDLNYKNVNYTTLKDYSNKMKELATSVINSSNPNSKLQEINKEYGTKVTELINSMIHNGNMDVNGALYMQIINMGLLDNPNLSNTLNNEYNKGLSFEEKVIEGSVTNNENNKTNTIETTIVNNPSNIFTSDTDQRIIYAYNKMRNDFGYTDAGAKAILANIINENSQIDPTITNGNGAFGICQWLNADRKNNLYTYCQNNNYDPSSLEGQLEFMNYELKNNYNNMANGADYGKLYDQLTGEVDKDYTNMTQNITVYYEAPSQNSSENNEIGLYRARSDNAGAVIELINNNI